MTAVTLGDFGLVLAEVVLPDVKWVGHGFLRNE